uniref:Hedgehog/Intein (Hint) domain-containing protein n=1 Tax=viral metagenome TaxID=1070528 RepID=A0A6C0HQ27_9ZZZZ
MNILDLTLAIFIILIFVGLFAFNLLTIGISKIKNNWPVYRCNPVVMPFASIFGQDAVTNFTYCIQTMQSNYMTYLMQPLHYSLDVIGKTGSNITDAINDVRAFFNNIRNFVINIVQSIFGVFLNILIEFQSVTITIKDMFSKMIGIMATLMFTLSGSIQTMTATWAGPPGQLARKLCFHPDTKVRLLNNKVFRMRDIPLNSILPNGTIVKAVMNISNLDDKGNHVEDLYSIKGGEGSDILVSGSHLVYDITQKQFIHSCELNCAIKTDIKCSEFSCLITSNHIIPIGKWIFHDWEDNNGSKSKQI